PRALRAKSMMRPTGQIAAQTERQRVAGGAQRSSHRCERPPDQLRRPGKSDSPHNSRIDGSIQKTAHIFHVMSQRDGLRIGERRGLELKMTVSREQLPYQAIFSSGEFVAR